MREKLIGFMAFLTIRFIGMTLNYQLHFKSEEDRDFFFKCHNQRQPTPDTRYLLAFYHQDELCLLNFFRQRNMGILISTSKDGEIMSQASSRLGYKSVRGSSSRKAVSGLLAAIKMVKSGYKMAFAVDGPRGPIYKVKPGVCALAKKTDTKIIPVKAIASNQIIFERAWNRAKFPKLFSTIDLYFDHPRIYQTQELESVLDALGS